MLPSVTAAIKMPKSLPRTGNTCGGSYRHLPAAPYSSLMMALQPLSSNRLKWSSSSLLLLSSLSPGGRSCPAPPILSTQPTEISPVRLLYCHWPCPSPYHHGPLQAALRVPGKKQAAVSMFTISPKLQVCVQHPLLPFALFHAAKYPIGFYSSESILSGAHSQFL